MELVDEFPGIGVPLEFRAYVAERYAGESLRHFQTCSSCRWNEAGAVYTPWCPSCSAVAFEDNNIAHRWEPNDPEWPLIKLILINGERK